MQEVSEMKVAINLCITARLIVLAGSIFMSTIHAAELPIIQFNMKDKIQAGLVSNGQRLGHGTVSFNRAHTGFRVWIDGRWSSDRPGSYILVGKYNPEHKLRVRLEGDGWAPDSENSKGIVNYSRDDMVHFYALVDGDQFIQADMYSLQVSGEVETLD